MSDDDDIILKDLNDFLVRSDSLFDPEATAVPVAAMKALLGVVERSQAETMMGLQDELKQATDVMIQKYSSRSYIALQSGCEIFMRYITRTYLEELNDFEECRQAILERGARFQTLSLAARDRIAKVAADFMDRKVILTHGWSRVVAAVLHEAEQPAELWILEGRPDACGARAAQQYCKETNIPVKVVLDSAMGYVMEQVDVVLVGAEGVLENGGIVNKIGTYALAACAKAAGKPFYVAAESFKFARMYPLHQTDLPDHGKLQCTFVDTSKASDVMIVDLKEEVTGHTPPVDFTPANLITFLFTDLGVLTPSAVSEELIRMYQ